MKQILAIIRDDQVGQTTTALAKIGIRGISFLYVTGRSGREKGTDSAREQRGVLNRDCRMQLKGKESSHRPAVSGDEIPGDLSSPGKESGYGFLPRRMLMIIVDDDDVEVIVRAILGASNTGDLGKGRIFICPVISTIPISSGETGEKSLS
ncbi:MAG: P-II family nitrogen regulator [Methanoregula sp.]|uniref:P-II family nitrogen regulator n=1 Tax=Methanoregula sp. TaxID=2052170 RepID=UPI003C38C6B9